MGTLKEHFQTKNEMRKAAGLPEWDEDNVEVCKTIRAASPPATGMEFMDGRRSRQYRQVGVQVMTNLHHLIDMCRAINL